MAHLAKQHIRTGPWSPSCCRKFDGPDFRWQLSFCEDDVLAGAYMKEDGGMRDDLALEKICPQLSRSSLGAAALARELGEQMVLLYARLLPKLGINAYCSPTTSYYNKRKSGNSEQFRTWSQSKCSYTSVVDSLFRLAPPSKNIKNRNTYRNFFITVPYAIYII